MLDCDHHPTEMCAAVGSTLSIGGDGGEGDTGGSSSSSYGYEETVFEMLNRTRPDFISSVPDHWLAQPKPSIFVRATISVVFSCMAIPGNASQILVLITFLR